VGLPRIAKMEIDFERGVFKSDGAEDHANLMDTLNLLLKNNYRPSNPPTPQGSLESRVLPTVTKDKGLTLSDVLDKFFLLKKVKPATVTAYKNAVAEFVVFHKSKCYIQEVISSDITRYREHLAEKGNSPRTIDNKISVLKAVFNFATEQSYFSGKNPAEIKNLQTKKQKLTQGYLIFELDEIKAIFGSEYFNNQKEEDPDYYYCLLFGLLTGCRISELTSLTFGQFKQTQAGTYYITIRDSKTSAGKREIPLPTELISSHFLAFVKNKTRDDKIFRYLDRDGKGSGNAVGKKFSRHLNIEKINRGKLVFHSLRKFLNDYFLKNNVDFESRCQFFGHEIDSVNVATYTTKYNVDQLFSLTQTPRNQLLRLIGM